ncbi:MAG: ABC transporter ATP-binding protein, partial [Stenotrophomonas nitritireducens]|nr:ABC transporter ATP-binding protein [Stenotrophomonas nitritireducens]
HYMDEAERCHRIAILDRGVLVADGTPAELTARLAGRTLVVDADRPRQAAGALSACAGVASVAQIGNSLRVLLDEKGSEAPLADALRAAGIAARMHPQAASLEDVFVAATRQRPAAGGEGA